MAATRPTGRPFRVGQKVRPGLAAGLHAHAVAAGAELARALRRNAQLGAAQHLGLAQVALLAEPGLAAHAHAHLADQQQVAAAGQAVGDVVHQRALLPRGLRHAVSRASRPGLRQPVGDGRQLFVRHTDMARQPVTPCRPIVTA